MTGIDLNSDLGEGFGIWTLGDDAALLEIVTSANVACGFHGGDPGIMRRTCAAAVERGVAIGAQVSYRDLAGFGRRKIDMPRADAPNPLTARESATSPSRNPYTAATPGRIRTEPRSSATMRKSTEARQASSGRSV